MQTEAGKNVNQKRSSLPPLPPRSFFNGHIHTHALTKCSTCNSTRSHSSLKYSAHKALPLPIGERRVNKYVTPTERRDSLNHISPSV